MDPKLAYELLHHTTRLIVENAPAERVAFTVAGLFRDESGTFAEALRALSRVEFEQVKKFAASVGARAIESADGFVKNVEVFVIQRPCARKAVLTLCWAMDRPKKSILLSYDGSELRLRVQAKDVKFTASLDFYE